MNVRKTLEEMLKVFDEKDWIQGTMYRPYGASIEEITGVCLEGSWGLCHQIRLLELADWGEVLPYLKAAIGDLFPARSNHGSPWQFNDHQDTTGEDVLLVIKTAAARASSQEQAPPATLKAEPSQK